MEKLPSERTQFNWKIPFWMRKRFDELCEKKGYKKQAQVMMMLKEWIAREESTALRSRNEMEKIKSVISGASHLPKTQTPPKPFEISDKAVGDQ